MRNTIAAAAAIAFTLIFSPMAAPPAHAAVDVSFDFFYSNLSPHGTWLASASYGRVWQPQVYRPGWNPYYDGHWQYADVGWVWVSDYQWGAVPYHYGTWVMDADYGWVWVPGYTWAPAWVEFRQGPEAVGWAPVSPEFAIGVSFGSRPAYYEPPPQAFVFVPVREFAAPSIRPYIVPERQVNTYIQNTTVIHNNLVVQNNVVVNRGPDVRVVERAAGRTIQPQPIERVSHAAPFQGFSRQQIRVPDQRQEGLRAAQPQLPPGMTQNRSNQIQREREQRPAPQQQQVPQPQQQYNQEQNRQRLEQQQREHGQRPQPTQQQKPHPPVPEPPPHMQPEQPAQQQAHGQGQVHGQQPPQQQQQRPNDKNGNKNNNNKKPQPQQDKAKKDHQGNDEKNGG
ncbi:MAG TPA: DUF6600 domain-containing protein [Candidatus Polarisedimenticolaceae bacterium]|nr:DUF6600 domain-containing protein [Candidatus Polarisedimenticolaceae bacterium]